MLFVKELHIVLLDIYRYKVRLFIWFFCYLLCILYLVKESIPQQGIMGIPQSLNLFFSSYTFIFPVLPLFLMFFSFGIVPFFDSSRFVRYKKRERVFLSLLLRVFWICLIFTLIYLIGGFLLGGFLSGRWDNVWLSTKGAPYLIYGDQLPLDEYFSSNIMLMRYLITSLLVFYLIGLFVVVCYLLSKNYIYSFIIISSTVILDKMLNIYFGFSFINDSLSLEMTSWLIPGLFSRMIYLFSGFGLLFTFLAYKIFIKQDFLNDYGIDHEKEC
ncbi:hypothetical protein LG401_01245 [Bacillus pumilus]|uniref:hypothetical protein n=1 Tax=Bacillus TaxID=1386 RepID=UPI001CFBC979|nr:MULTISPECIES: hypothetical protein [Bacillus]MCW6699734.1 hypothetical protein [Bacillus sp. RP12]UCZ71196.1 hypothetical protein LG401_01245 [Bacillus pumilus]